MHMVRHQRIGMNLAPVTLGPQPQPVQVKTIIVLGKETRLAVIASLHDMLRQSGKIQARAALDLTAHVSQDLIIKMRLITVATANWLRPV
jgi:hypothetical protein